jgi:hypothetical protein
MREIAIDRGLLVAAALAAVSVNACGGRGGGSGGSPPGSLSYSSPSAFVVNQAITPLVPTVSRHELCSKPAAASRPHDQSGFRRHFRHADRGVRCLPDS